MYKKSGRLSVLAVNLAAAGPGGGQQDSHGRTVGHGRSVDSKHG